MKIHKFPISLEERQTVALPYGARALHVGVQAGVVCLWALFDEKGQLGRGPVAREFAVYGTGFALPDDVGTHLGTVQIDGFVWHVFEVTP
jgi:hypothetical protein